MQQLIVTLTAELQQLEASLQAQHNQLSTSVSTQTVTNSIPSSTATGLPVISGVDGPASLSVGQQGTWTVHASASNLPGAQLNYSVIWGDESTFAQIIAFANGTSVINTSSTFNHTYQTAGTYRPTVTVSNNSGSTKSSVSVVVTNAQGTTLCTTPSVQTQTMACPAGQTGAITQSRTPSCATGTTAPVWSSWTQTADTCVTSSASTPASSSCIWSTSGKTFANGSVIQACNPASSGSACPAGLMYPADFTGYEMCSNGQWVSTTNTANTTTSGSCTVHTTYCGDITVPNGSNAEDTHMCGVACVMQHCSNGTMVTGSNGTIGYVSLSCTGEPYSE